MKIYFNSLGVVRATDFTGDSLRQGSVGIELKVYFDGIDNTLYRPTLNYTRHDGSVIGGIADISLDPTNNELYTYKFNDPWFFAKAGSTTLTIYLHDSGGNVIAQGQVTFNIEKTDYIDDPQFNIPEIILKALYPVGSIYMSTEQDETTKNLAGKYGCKIANIGGTWERMVGRFLLPCASGGAGETGGSGEHTHTLSSGFAKMVFRNEGNIDIEYKDSTPTWTANSRIRGGTLATSSATSNEGVKLAGSSGSATSYPPYIQVYAWKRIA